MPSVDPPAPIGIGVVVLTYESDRDLLERSLRSVVAAWAQAGAGTHDGADRDRMNVVDVVDIVVADNASPTAAGATRSLVALIVAETGAPLRFLSLEANHGFAGGNNRAIASLKESADLVFLLNPDAELEPGALVRCAGALRDAPASTVSAAPKMLLTRTAFDEPTIDSVGNAVNAKGEAFNIGLGQPDIGQYDLPAACFGPCFGAAMIRRSAFGPAEVGKIDESLFLYYEDVEWNWRAQILGYSSITVPTARVRHVMSASTRDLPYDFKFRLNERNLLMVALACIPGRQAYTIVGRRVLGLLRGAVRGHYPVAGLRAVGGFAVHLPAVIARRRTLQRSRQRSHDEILGYGHDEQTFFDAVRHQPVRGAEARRFAETRKERTGVASRVDKREVGHCGPACHWQYVGCHAWYHYSS